MLRLMARRLKEIFPDQIYHVYNRSVARLPIFLGIDDFKRFLKTIDFYRFAPTGLCYSHYCRLTSDAQKVFRLTQEERGQKLVSVYCFCLMPNHFHFLLRGLVDGGVQKFTANLQNSYAKYFNTKRGRNGSLFQEMFKANLVESDDLFLHISRYIHLNPLSSSVVKDFKDLKAYPWSSLPSYLGFSRNSFIEKETLENYFSNKKEHESFIFDQADYQKSLEEIKHLLPEDDL